jgi:hypothetical protein
MKHSKIFITLLLIGGLFGCNKEDTTAPVITLIGADPLNHEMRQAYNDPGATAMDDEDGDLTQSISKDLSEIDVDLPGSYSIIYSVSDAAGNIATEDRELIVYATPAALVANYNVIDTASVGTQTSVYSYPQSISLDPINSNRIKFSKFGDYSNANSIYAIVNQDGTLTIPTQNALNIGLNSEDHEFSGTGRVLKNGIYIEYTDKNNSAVPVSTASCKAYFTR